MEKLVSNIPKRLYEIMHKLNISQADLSRTTGITTAGISLYAQGKRIPRQDKISQICEPFNINPAWLMGYDVPMFNSSVYADENTDFITACLCDKNLQFIIKTYDELSPERRLEFVKFANYMANTKDDIITDYNNKARL